MRTELRDRLVSGVGAAIVTGLLGAVLAIGLTVTPEAVHQEVLRVFALSKPPPPPPPVPPEHVHQYRAAHAAGAPAPKAKATPIVAPPPVVRLPPPIPVVTATRPETGNQAASGASPLSGVGTGAGGVGDGPGGGGEGSGEGDDTPPRQIGGRLRFSDLPEDRVRLGGHWRVWVEYQVDLNGRVHDCRIDRSGGDREIDEATCMAIERRFRFRPAEDGDGRPFEATVEEYHDWTVDRADDDPPPR